MMKCDDREVAMRLGQLEPCEHDALLKVGGESLIRREIQIQRGVSRNWAGPGTGRVTSMALPAVCHSVLHTFRTTFV
jgi:hypothetical protein